MVDPSAQVTFLHTHGSGSLNFYSAQLAAHLRVPLLQTDAYQRIRLGFDAHPALALQLAARDRVLALSLRRTGRSFHFPNQHLGRYASALRVPFAITVHDVIRWIDARGDEPALIHEPGRIDRWQLQRDVRGVRRARAVIAVSECTRRDVVRLLGVPPDLVHVVYNGVDHERFAPTELRLLDPPYILYVGSEHPRKNLRTLLRAFAALKRDGHDRLKLVKLGSAGGPERDFRAATLSHVRELGLGGEVIFAEHVPDSELAAWYSGAVATVMPSLYEGFGLPALEGMACGSPVVVANAGALPEVVGDAGLIVPPEGAADLAHALRAVRDPQLSERLAAAGRERAQAFSWQRAAAETERVYETLSDRHPAREPMGRQLAEETLA